MRKKLPARTKKTIAAVVISVAAACLVVALVITTVVIPKRAYDAQVEKYGRETVETFYALEERDEYLFGTYEQDNDLSDGEEEIEWIVIAREESRVLLMSKYALDCMPYEDAEPGADWASSSVREWLNGEFLNGAFDDIEREMILTAAAQPGVSIRGPAAGSDAGDAVFLLSDKETEKLLRWNKAKVCLPTEYAAARGAEINIDGSCSWWLRSQGMSPSFAAYVHTFGGVVSGGISVNNGGVAVRPALWISVLA